MNLKVCWCQLLFFLFMPLFVPAQKYLFFIPRIGNHRIALNKEIKYENRSFYFNTVKIYLTNIQCYSSKKVSYTNRICLIDLEDTKSMVICSYDSTVTHIDMNLGTDSMMNISGIFEGALDPVNGMYWAWNSGYISVKVEGVFADTAGAKKPFEFHVGGYLSPHTTVRNLSFEINSAQKVPVFFFQMEQWLLSSFEKGLFDLMTPGKDAVLLAKWMQQSIYLVETDE